jgi:hypothetical protein
MQNVPFRTFTVEFLEKRYTIFALVFLVHGAVHIAGKHIQCRKYGGCAVPEVIGALTGGDVRP